MNVPIVIEMTRRLERVAHDTFIDDLAPRTACASRAVGGFGGVIGVDRIGQADALRTHGADVVLADLADLLGSP